MSRQWWWMVIITHESYDSVLVGTGKQKGLESLSENREWWRRCDVERQVVPDGGTRNQIRPLADCRETNWRNVQTMWGRRPQPSSESCDVFVIDVDSQSGNIEWQATMRCGVGLSKSKNVKSNYFIVHPKVDQRAGQLTLPHFGNFL